MRDGPRLASLGEMGRLIAAKDWSATPLGAVRRWSPELVAAINTCLPSRVPMLLWWGPELLQIYNDAYVPTLGDKHPRSLGQPAAECWAEAWADLGPLARKVLDGEGATYSDNHPLLLNRHGYVEETYWTFSYSPVLDRAGEVLGIFVATTDTTRQVLGERRMRALHELAAARGAVDPDAACEAIRRVLGEFTADIPHAEIHVAAESGAAARVMVSGRAEWRDDVVVQPLVASGRPAPIGALVLGISPRRALDTDYRLFLDLVAGQVGQILAHALDYQAERQRAEALARLDRAKSEFFSNVSHEFRTPLTLIAGPAEDALADAAEPLAAGQRERLRIIRRNAGRLGRLVDDLLDFARIEAGRLQPDAVDIDLAALTREVAESFGPAVRRAGLEFTVSAPPLPRAARVDPDMWEKVLLNLLSNALKYTRSGGIELSLLATGDHARLTVSDTGVGIPEDQIPLLFQSFHRVQGSSGRSPEGTGIGLALVHELVRLHGGSVSATSETGVGSEFSVLLPLSDADRAATHRPRGSTVYLEEALRWSAPEPMPSSVGVKDSAVVLVVEDNADMRGFLLRLLEPHWRVLLAADGTTGLRMARTHQPDLVLSDVTTPGLDGFGLVRELRADPATAPIPVLVLSARSGEIDTVEGLAAGADDYLPKPFSSNELVARVRANLELARLRSRESRFRRALVDSLQEGFLVADGRGAVIEINSAFTEITGYPASELPTSWPHPWLFDAEEWPEEHRAQQKAFERFLAESGGQFRIPLRHRKGHRIWVAVSTTTVPDDGGERLFVCTLRDVTAEKLAAERDTTITRFAAVLAAATDVGEVLGSGIAALRLALGVSDAVAAIFSADGAPELVVGDLHQAAREALTAAKSRPVATVLVALSETPGVAAPLGGNDAAVWLGLGTGRLLSAEEEALFGLLSSHLAQALHRARDYERAREVALTLQHAILGPTDLPPGFAVRYEPAVQPLEVGGDWYDVARLPDGRIGVVVGDCVGRGLEAAAVMGQLRSSARALLLRANGPAQALEDLDTFAAQIPGALCTTLFCAVIDPADGTLRYSNAGHPPPVLAHLDGTHELLSERSLPLAVMPGRSRQETKAQLRPGSTLLLYTDGLIERRDVPVLEGIGAAQQLVLDSTALRPSELADRLLAELLPPVGHDDDVAVLVYRHPPPPLALELPALAEKLASMRTDLRAWLARADVTADAAEPIVVAACEAVTNAMEHGYSADPDGRVRVTVRLDGSRVEVVVTDTGRWLTPDPAPRERGRGVRMMRALMDDVVIDSGNNGTTVRMWRRRST
ncbi:SpoIIE family protein phosphatase [Allokutzneria sp. A3M-2-11 16]|uniref:SpoIIE family protein phosphatase n=1 Tax=Allokutzneria sp. A3M-2-11 16 TaxID=2962043 RepID=UPI0020B73025|nr:SpoIIE family protein phosphatase [Allokutzneria sp. A3M-2-11 16]MCP3803878.1 SpoIIE family protein phosphatase [Allokutzneria sp. A3M-2-11 16]